LTGKHAPFAFKQTFAFLAALIAGKKTILLFFISILSLYLFFLIPKNREWLNDRVMAYWFDFRRNKNRIDPEFRKIKRWESDYTISKEISGHFIKKGLAKEALILVPPTQYFIDRKILYHVPEPAVFYYYTGLKTVWINSEKAMQANWIVTARNQNLLFIPVTDKKMLADSIQSFKKYPVQL
jgi:hypothetical protein